MLQLCTAFYSSFTWFSHDKMAAAYNLESARSTQIYYIFLSTYGLQSSATLT